MLREDKELLLKDLCARLPFGVILRDDYGELTNVNLYNAHIEHLIDRVSADIEKIMLRPMSSMTEDEKKEFYSVPIDISDGQKNEEREAGIILHYSQIDWLNVHHFDYRGLIEKGLALEAPEGMYKNK